MKNERTFFLGAVPDDSTENRTRKGWIVIYTCFEPDELEPLIGIYEGPNGHHEGSSAETRRWYERPLSSYERVEGRIVEHRPGPGWFDRLCAEIGAGWFVPIAHRLRSEENVPLKEIQAAHAGHKDGQPLPEGTITDFFKLTRDLRFRF